MEDIEKQLEEMFERGGLTGYTIEQISSNKELMQRICDDFSGRDTTDEYWIAMEFCIEKNLEVFHVKA